MGRSLGVTTGQQKDYGQGPSFRVVLVDNSPYHLLPFYFVTEGVSVSTTHLQGCLSSALRGPAGVPKSNEGGILSSFMSPKVIFKFGSSDLHKDSLTSNSFYILYYMG